MTGSTGNIEAVAVKMLAGDDTSEEKLAVWVETFWRVDFTIG